MATFEMSLAITNLGLIAVGEGNCCLWIYRPNSKRNFRCFKDLICHHGSYRRCNIGFNGTRWISLWTFGDAHYTTHIRAISFALLFNNFGLPVHPGHAFYRASEDSKPQGQCLGNLIALLVTVPCIFIGVLDAIVPAIIVTAVISFCLPKGLMPKVRTYLLDHSVKRLD